MKYHSYIALLILFCLLLGGCAPKGRYYQRHDSAPQIVPSSAVTKEDAIPRYEPYAQANLRPYTVLGQYYTPLTTAKGYSAQGQASWYGQKFHGHLTSNGEIYDMYKMSAAHKTLPLPSFVRVTNLANGKQAVVRVNDRGPFHDNRIIDLSYAAALKLDVLKTGVAKVKLDVIHVDQSGKLTVGNRPIVKAKQKQPAKQSAFIQILALKDKSKLEKMGKALQSLYQTPFKTVLEDNIYKLRLGPINSVNGTNYLLKELKSNGYAGAYKILAD